MLINGKYISCLEIIRECYKNKKYSYELDYSDAIEWCVTAIDLIGSPVALRPSQCKIKIHNYKGKIPCDVYNIDMVAGSYNGCTPFPMRSTTNSFGAVNNYVNMQINPQLIEGTINGETIITQPIGQDISGNPVYYFQGGNIAMPGVISTSPTSLGNLNNISTYSLNDSFIFTSFKDGYVFLAYQALPVDENGFPLVLDNTRYKKGVEAYICYQIDYILWRNGELEDKIFKHSELQWEWYCGSASTITKTLSKDQLRSLFGQIRLIPKQYQHENFYKTLGN